MSLCHLHFFKMTVTDAGTSQLRPRIRDLWRVFEIDGCLDLVNDRLCGRCLVFKELQRHKCITDTLPWWIVCWSSSTLLFRNFYCIGLCSVLCPHQHSIGNMGDGFYRSKDPTNSIKVLKEKATKDKANNENN